MDQKQSNSINKVIGCVFILFGFAILCIGVPFIFIDKRSEFENTIMALSIISGVLMLIGGYQNIAKGKQKDKAVGQYEKQVENILKTVQTDKKSINSAVNKPLETQDLEIYKPDIIAKWNYTIDEWKLMTKEETTRRLKEGIWVTIGIAGLGTWVLSAARGASILTGFMISAIVGVFLSFLKVLISNNLFKLRKTNSIIITTNALIVNGKFKTINDNDIKLEYIKSLKVKEDNFIEFSLQWLTRGSVTNDQFRIYVPLLYENEIQKVLDYYRDKGVRTWD